MKNWIGFRVIFETAMVKYEKMKSMEFFLLA